VFWKKYLGVISLVLPMMNTEIDRDKWTYLIRTYLSEAKHVNYTKWNKVQLYIASVNTSIKDNWQNITKKQHPMQTRLATDVFFSKYIARL